MIAALLATAFAACGCTYIAMRWLPRFGFVDVPNERSSHEKPTATLGGSGLVLGFLAGCVVYAEGAGEMAWETWGLIALGCILAVFAWDELRPMGRLLKLAVQAIAAVLLLTLLGPLDRLTLPAVGPVPMGSWGGLVTLCLYVAIQNFYNFMDGIDGLAGTEGFLAAGAFAVLLSMVDSVFTPLPALLAAASLGFLVWNLPAARIFLGDMGGHFLGLMLTGFVVVGERAGVAGWLGLAVLGAFLFDAIYTIVRRALKGENITEAHRFHLYQRLVRSGWAHMAVVVVYGVHTVALGGGAILVVAGHQPWGHGLIAAAFLSMAVGTVLIERRWTREGETT